ncbi:MAG: hypothetical protein BroJett030_27870 [Alphaproteobacteria bacterium]|nr:MAG: hypothetical protein BroJett030_27870 [Alphaproteobacteria bacterium]
MPFWKRATRDRRGIGGVAANPKEQGNFETDRRCDHIGVGKIGGMRFAGSRHPWLPRSIGASAVRLDPPMGATARSEIQKKPTPDGPTVSINRARSRKRFRASQLVSAITRHPWQAAP